MPNKIRKVIPILPATALIFCCICVILWKLQLIPTPQEILIFLEALYLRYGNIGLFIATLLESFVYLGLYFPGSVIIALAVFLSDGKLISLFVISLLVAIALTLTSAINYLLGKMVSKNNKTGNLKQKVITKGLFASMLHPNLLSFYFFNAGIERQNFKKILYVPIFMIPYGMLFGFILSRFSTSMRKSIESPYFILFAVILWFFASLVFEYRRKNSKEEIKKVSRCPREDLNP